MPRAVIGEKSIRRLLLPGSTKKHERRGGIESPRVLEGAGLPGRGKEHAA
jgi:hypothetical protein